jgi:hypothetical protein
VQYSTVRSLTLDSWTEKQLKMMSLGGNKAMRDYLKGYDLGEESVAVKYKSKAAEYYRRKVSYNLLTIHFS